MAVLCDAPFMRILNNTIEEIYRVIEYSSLNESLSLQEILTTLSRKDFAIPINRKCLSFLITVHKNLHQVLLSAG